MKKLKAITAIMLGGLAVASCTDKNDNGTYSTRTTFTAAASVGGGDLGTINGWTNPGSNTQTFSNGITVHLSSIGTVAQFVCPVGEVSFDTSALVICNNAGGCTVHSISVVYSDPINTPPDNWTEFTYTSVQGNSINFYKENFDSGGFYDSGLSCIPQDQVSYWS